MFAFSSLAALIHYGATFGVIFLLSLYLQYIQAMPPQKAGLVLMIQPVIMALVSPLAGMILSAYRGKLRPGEMTPDGPPT